ncbi:putative gustatory receptor 28b [Culex quinquefasciatus]|nr:putative gustatory receptor 28b [Culex quinquefasciatus]
MAISHLNDAFRYSHVATMAHYFYILTTYSFYIIYSFSVEVMREKIYFELVMILIIVIYISYVMYICEEIKQESNLMSRNIHITNYNKTLPLGNKEIGLYLELVSQQLLHQQLNLHANSFFNIDLKFLNLMVGAVTTYLVILLQFNA